MTGYIIANEWLQFRRDKRLLWLGIFLLLISLVALWHQLDFQSNLLDIRKKAQADSRREWLSQELKHPHVAAHFGNYAYAKPSLLHCFDPGVTIYTGTSVYMEPHRQNDMLFSKSQESDTGLRFGWLSPALVCQLLIPLLIIIVSFNGINGEYEKGTMPLLLSQGANFSNILFAKVIAVYTIFAVFFTIYMLITVILGRFLLQVPVDLLPAGYLWIVYNIYFLVWSLIGTVVSSRVRVAGSAIAILLLIWTFTNILLPRITANIAENIYPLTTNYQFRKNIATAIEQGLDGHDPQSDRAKKIEQELLKKYKVDSVQQLPFNFEGHIMQQAEEYSSKVYDNYFAGIFTSLKQQKTLQAWTGILSPYISVRNISMTISEAGVESAIDFQQQAEQYRRDFVQNMNDDMRDNSAFGSFDTYKVSEGKYAAITDFEVDRRPLRWLASKIIIDNMWLVLWLVVSLMLLATSRKRFTVNR